MSVSINKQEEVLPQLRGYLQAWRLLACRFPSIITAQALPRTDVPHRAGPCGGVVRSDQLFGDGLFDDAGRKSLVAVRDSVMDLLDAGSAH